MDNTSTKNEYKFKFYKRGLTRGEFKECLQMKVDEILKSFINLKRKIKKLKDDTVEEATKEFCLRVNETNPYTIDRRFSSTRGYIEHGILVDHQQSPKEIVKHSKGRGQGHERADKVWKKQYHEEQKALYSLPFIQDILFHLEITVDRQGYLLKSSGNELTPLSTPEFCRVIDNITYTLGRELSKLGANRPNENYRNQWGNSLKSCCFGCKKVVMLRFIMDCSIDNDLMVQEKYEIWRNHVKVLISFAALRAVAKMMINRLENNWGPEPQLSITGSRATTSLLVTIMVMRVLSPVLLSKWG